ncbi:MAG: O-antigen ligase family protein [Gaiellaceae bacterium]
MSPLLLVPPALIVALALDQGGFDPSSWVWSGAIAAWAAATAAVTARELRASRHAQAWLASACAVLAWTVLSWLWSDRRVQTVLELRRTAVYVAAALALVALVRRSRVQHVLLLTHAAIVVVIVYALARYLTESRTFDPFEGELLAQPLGYANALGALSAIGIVLGAGLAALANIPQVRWSAAASIPILAATLPLTHSRGAVVALGAGLAAVVLCAEDAALYMRTALLVAPGAAAAAAAATFSRLSDGHGTHPAHAGWILGGIVVVSALATAVAAAATPATGKQRRHVPRLAVTASLAIGAAAAVVATGSTEPRASLWRVAWHEFTAHAALGSGAGTFALAWVRSGLVPTRGGALDAHSLYLETLAELGLIGLVLLLAFLLVPLAHAKVRTGPAPVAAGAYVVFLVHAGLDWDWEMPAVVLTGLCCGVAALASEESRMRQVGTRGRAGMVVLSLALGALSIAGARSSSEPGVARPLAAVVLGARVAVPVAVVPVLPVPVALPVRVPAEGPGRAGRKRVPVAEVRLQGPRGHGDRTPRMLPRVRAVTDLHAVLPAR